MLARMIEVSRSALLITTTTTDFYPVITHETSIGTITVVSYPSLVLERSGVHIETDERVRDV